MSRSPRSLESFGVVGVLSDKCKIYYDSIFTTAHVGRITDLLSARLKNSISDELRFRIILTFSFYEAYRCQTERFGMKHGSTLPEPLTVECGIDEEKIAIGVSLNYGENEPVDPSLAQKVAEGKMSTRFERLVAQMAVDADQVIVRIQPEVRRVEIISLLGLPGPVQASGRRPIEVIHLGADSEVSGLPGEYIELGDVDYRKLLEEQGPRVAQGSPTGDILVKGTLEEAESVRKVAGQADEKEKLTRISGVTEHIQQEGIKTVVPEYPDLRNELAEAIREKELNEQKIEQLMRRIEELESRVESEGLGKSVRTIFKSWFGGKAKTSEDPAPETHEEVRPRTAEAQYSAPDVDPLAEKLLREQVENLESTIARMKQEAGKIGSEGGGSRAQKWADGMIGQLLAEKSRIQDIAKKLNLSVRQKEIEFRNRETYLNEQLRKKEDLLRQKTFAFDRSRDQIAQLTAAAERSRTQHSAVADEQSRQKLNFSQKLLQVTKDENFELTKQVEELRAQVSEFKRANQFLMERLNEIQKPKPGSSGPEELKRKLEKAMKLAVSYQKEAEQLKIRVKELELGRAKRSGSSGTEAA